MQIGDIAPTSSFSECTEEAIEQSIPDRFERVVRRYPDRLAVKTRHHEFTYEELNQIANRIARAILSQRGKGQEPIALLLENEAPMIGAILGVLKTGKMYVPLDPSLPRARLAYMLEDSQAGLIVTNGHNLASAVDLSQGEIAWIDVDRCESGPELQDVSVSIAPDALAWILYTSGSTGQPKGVVQSHRNLLQFVRNYSNGLRLSASDRLSQLSSSQAVIFSALLNGASLHLWDIRAEGLTGLPSWLVEQESTVYYSVPTVFRHFCQQLSGTEEFPKLRLIILTGEPVTKRDVDLYKKHFSSDCILINRLGSTETGTIRWNFINKETPIDEKSVPVGYPVPDNEILLLDERGKEVPAGEAGEIAVKSQYLSPGYWRKPELTKKAFFADPHSGERIYRSGDLGQMLSNGCLLHLGRKDFQVKIRGHRIETAEIEMALLNLAGIGDAIVMAREDQHDEPHLVAYVVVKGRPQPTAGGLRRALAASLPNYMIPSAFVILDSFPLAPNGKVNRGALPRPDRLRPDLENRFAVPRTLVESELAQIWAEVLSLDRVGIHDNFFDLGGHSLAATQIISRVVKRFQLELPIQSLFQAPTVAEMAAVIAQGRETQLGEGFSPQVN
jgi:amino acid adenylation domain-containing protein